jgi:hypothetical protein
MANQQIGEELSKAARTLFNSAARKWYGAIALEVVAGVFAAVSGLFDLAPSYAVWSALLATVLLVCAYVLRLQYDHTYELAETMRRQSVLSEALDWPVSARQLSEWRRSIGKKIRLQVKATIRDPDYYDTKQAIGPARLAEMTFEAAFYTRQLYIKLRYCLIGLLTAACLLVALVVFTALTDVVPKTAGVLIATFLLSAAPIVLTLDLLGWVLRLGRLIAAICDVEDGLRDIITKGHLDQTEVLRLVSEYNCQVIGGFPIHNWLFSRWHNEVKELWEVSKI